MPGQIGEGAALAVSLCWSASAIFFAIASQRLGALVVNRGRLVLASALLVATHLAIYGSLIPMHASSSQWLWLSLSGLVGLAIGDSLLFQAYVDLGPRLSMLLVSTSPVISAVLATIFLGQSLSPSLAIGILVTMGGVAWVILEPDGSPSAAEENRHRFRGVLLGLGASAGQAVGLVLSKLGLSAGFPALSGVVIRMLSATVVLWLFALVQKQVRSTISRLTGDPNAVLPLFGGAVAGPYLGVWLSLVAIQSAPVGIASTLMALPPIFMVGIDRVLFHKHIGWQAMAGTLVATGGVALLFLAS